MKSAETQLLESLDQMLLSQDDSILIPLTKLNQGIASAVASNAKTVNKLISKVLKGIDKEMVSGLDALDGVKTRVLQGLDQWLLNQQYLLESLAHKSGDLPIGSPLTELLEASTTESPQVTYAGTLVLELSKLEPLALALLRVLEQIRDRMPPPPSIALAEDAGVEPGWTPVAAPSRAGDEPEVVVDIPLE